MVQEEESSSPRCSSGESSHLVSGFSASPNYAVFHKLYLRISAALVRLLADLRETRLERSTLFKAKA